MLRKQWRYHLGNLVDRIVGIGLLHIEEQGRNPAEQLSALIQCNNGVGKIRLPNC